MSRAHESRNSSTSLTSIWSPETILVFACVVQARARRQRLQPRWESARCSQPRRTSSSGRLFLSTFRSAGSNVYNRFHPRGLRPSLLVSSRNSQPACPETSHKAHATGSRVANGSSDRTHRCQSFASCAPEGRAATGLSLSLLSPLPLVPPSWPLSPSDGPSPLLFADTGTILTHRGPRGAGASARLRAFTAGHGPPAGGSTGRRLVVAT